MSSINHNVTVTQAFNAATRQHGWLAVFLLPLAYLKVLFSN